MVHVLAKELSNKTQSNVGFLDRHKVRVKDQQIIQF